MTDKQPGNPSQPDTSGLELDDPRGVGQRNSSAAKEAPAPLQTAAPSGPQTPRNANGAPKARMGDRLLQLGAITQDQLDVALREKARAPEKMVGNILVELGFITDEMLTRLLAESTGHESLNIRDALIDPEAVKRVPRNVALQYRLLPVSISDEKAVIAMADPFDVLAMDQLRRYLPRGVQIEPRVCPEDDIINAIDRNFGYDMSVSGILRELETGEYDVTAPAAREGYTHPLVRLVDALMLDAVKLGASDIHFEPEELFVRLRYRLDGRLQQVRTIHKEHWSAMSHRLKIISGMNIADRLHPQDGRLSMRIGNREIDFRVSVMPTTGGENIVLRILDKAKAVVTLDQLGFSGVNRRQIDRILKRPEGIIIVTGPTGSGKTTTLYAMLSAISNPNVNIMTLEDPVEYELPMVRQTQIRENQGLTFGEGIRNILRQDPDIIFIGEVRDSETAQMALRAAMTGHQVFTTLHTNDALGALPRLYDLGLEPAMLSGNIIGVFAQRLVGLNCASCKRPRPATADECLLLETEADAPPQIWEAPGCEACHHSGIKGRTAIAEVIYVDEELDELIATRATRTAMRAHLRENGQRSLAQDGIERVRDGSISLASLVRAADLTARM
ncbi:MAG: GspE/PulE family protein [Pseudomonadota bacterium]|jgi:type II secretory ATPase GspE/PulE/Tfp pilus assembly ATPase PilB-like protein